MAPAVLGLGGWGSTEGLALPFAARLLSNAVNQEAVPKCECGFRTALKSGPAESDSFSQ